MFLPEAILTQFNIDPIVARYAGQFLMNSIAMLPAAFLVALLGKYLEVQVCISTLVCVWRVSSHMCTVFVGCVDAVLLFFHSCQCGQCHCKRRPCHALRNGKWACHTCTCKGNRIIHYHYVQLWRNIRLEPTCVSQGLLGSAMSLVISTNTEALLFALYVIFRHDNSLTWNGCVVCDWLFKCAFL